MSSGEYDIIVIGGGSAGIVSGVTAAGLGAKTLLIEKQRLGGECSWTGCVPSKALLHAASIAHRMRNAGQCGLPPCAISREQAAGALAYVREMVERVRIADDSAGLLAEMGAEVVFGEAVFTGPDRLDFEGKTLRARQFVLCTGSRPTVPDIPGLEEAGYLTNQTLFDLTEVPESLVVIGGGPVGVEMAQAFARLGSRVTILTRGPRLLERDDAELTEMLMRYLQEEGITIHLNAKIERIERRAGSKVVAAHIGEEPVEVPAEAILVATGRAPNVEGLNLDRAGVRVEKEGVPVDARLHTTGPRVWACGDVLGRYQFSHMAEYEARTAVLNALFPLRQKARFRLVPWTTFTDPELAHAGLTEQEAKEKGLRFAVYRHPFDRDDRALVDGEGKGLVKLIVAEGWRGRILGAQILGPRAGELIHVPLLAMERGLTVRALADLITVYPKLNISIQRAAQRWYQRLGERPPVRALLNAYFRYLTPRSLSLKGRG
ncbi:MAG TPA: FAD-dependent oxidoreductase [Chthonomonadaceae bacterium]|nr:FAD-dependent oxidoreductase [Chthonomonadaceae bacterium]